MTNKNLDPHSPTGIHHVAYACRDGEATRHFYEDLLEMPLVHTEVTAVPNSDAYFRHIFFDTGDGTCIAFFELHQVGEKPDWRSDVSTGNGLPVWVNHIAFRADARRQDSARARMAAEDIKPIMDVDHGWCHSHYYLDPNGIMVEFCRDTPGFTPDKALARERLAEQHS